MQEVGRVLNTILLSLRIKYKIGIKSNLLK